jgi:hypothetical protein
MLWSLHVVFLREPSIFFHLQNFLFIKLSVDEMYIPTAVSAYKTDRPQMDM